MSKNYTTLSEGAIRYLCGLIRDTVSVGEAINDIHLASNSTFSSVMIDTLIKKCLEDSNEYTEKLVANLSRLELKLVTSESEITESNILYLFKPDGATSYNQYVVIEGNKVLLGTCDINMADYIKAADVAKDYATKVELKAVTDKIGTTTLTTTDTTITGAIEEVKRIAEGKAESFTFNSDDFSVDTATSAVKLTPERRVYNGTRAAWDSLSVAEKTQYGATAFTDDEGVSGDVETISLTQNTNSAYKIIELKAIRMGNIVNVVGIVEVITQMEILTIATGFPPPLIVQDTTNDTHIYLSGQRGTNNDGQFAKITKDGALLVYTSNSGGNYYFSGSYIA